MNGRQKLVVIGNGMAGVRCVEEILQLASHLYEITIVGKEPHPNYNRIMLSKVLQGDASIADITINSYEWYEQNGITLYAGETAERIDSCKKLVSTNRGRVVPYDRLIISTGSSPFMLPLPGADKEGVTAFRSIEDCERMMEAAKHHKRAVVIGGGLLGLEAARGLLNLGMEVQVVHIYDYLMDRQLDHTASGMLRKELETQGMRFVMGKQTERILGRKRVEGILFTDGTRLLTDLVVFAVGIRPNVKIAADSGIEVSRGIVVNDYMETSVQGIYAVGECAEHRGMAYGLVAPLYEQGKVLARMLCGVETGGYGGSVLYSQLKVSGVDVFSVGEIVESEASESIKMYNGLARTYRKIVVRDNRIAGAVLFGDIAESSKLLNVIKKGGNDLSLLDSLIGQGSAGKHGQSAEALKEEGLKAAAMLPDKEVVCSCNGVTKGTIVQAISDNGLVRLEEVKACTRASSSCGGCKPVVQSILDYVLENGGTAELKKETICGCTDFSHDELREALRILAGNGVGEAGDNVSEGARQACAANRMIGALAGSDAYRLRERLGWLHADGCEACDAALRYYAVLWGAERSPDAGLYGEQIEMTINARHPLRDSLLMGERLERALKGLVFPAELQLGIAAGLFHSGGMLTKDLALIGTPSGWELYAGGSDGGFGQLGLMPVQQAKLICMADSDDDALCAALSLLQIYRRSAIFGESVAEWLERAGVVSLREELFDRRGREELLAEMAVTAGDNPSSELEEKAFMMTE